MHHKILKAFYTTVSIMLMLTACASRPTAQSAFNIMGHAAVSGAAEVWTDANITVAIGEAEGAVDVQVSRSGYPLVIPFDIQQGFTFVQNRALGVTMKVPDGKPLPFWALIVLPDAAIDAHQFTFEPQFPNPSPVTPAPATTPVAPSTPE